MGFTSNNSDYTWIIDPIDGTRSYVIGRPLWGTLISLVFKGEPIIGMADFPALDERWIGYKNKCLLNNVAFKKIINPSQAYLKQQLALQDHIYFLKLVNKNMKL